MSQQLRANELQYEGFPLEAVLERVFAERGPDASITSADRVRKGGIGGFFAKEVFRVTVAVEADAPARPPRSFATLGRIGVDPDDTDLDAGLDEIDPEDIDGALALDVAAERTAEEQKIWAMLAEVTRPTPVADQEPASPAAVPLFGRGRLESLGLTVQEPVQEEPVQHAPVQEEPSEDPLAWSTQFWMVDPEDTVGTDHEPYRFPTEFGEGVLAEALMSVPEVVTPIVSSGPIASTVLVAPPSRPPMEQQGSVVALRSRRVRRSFATQIHLDELIAEFEESAGRIPEIPDRGIVAIVGGRDEAIEVAEMLARQLRIDPDEVLLASPQAPIEIPSHVDATRLAATARYRCTPLAIVVVELVPGRLGHEWARTVLAGLRAEQVRFATATDRVVSQQQLAIAAVGGVDAVDLVDATSCPRPEAMLDLGVPVATIDGRRAGPEMWAATVLASNHRAAGTVDRSAAATR